MKTTIYHNPRCSKSRKTLELLQENNIDYNIIEYLKTTLSKSDINNILNLANLSAREIMRTKENIYKEKQLDNLKLSNCDLIDNIINNPILLERPIVIHNNKARICRPPELVLDLIK